MSWQDFGYSLFSQDWEDTVYSVLDDVYAERIKQHRKWGEQNHQDGTGPAARILENTDVNLDLRTGGELSEIFRNKCQRNASGQDTYRDILLEEVFEAMAESDKAKLREELTQVAAVAVAWCEKIDRELAIQTADGV